MIDIIGFWTTITLSTIVLLTIWLFVFYLISKFAISQVTEDSDLTNRLMGKFFKEVDHEHSLLFNKYVVNDLFVFWSCLLSAVMWVVSAVGYHKVTRGYDNFYDSYAGYVIDRMASIAELASPVVGTIVVSIVAYWLVLNSLRKGYKFIVRVNRVIK